MPAGGLPRTESTASVADMQSGAIRATVVQYEAEDVINWRMEKQGAYLKLAMVVISECQAVQVDEFETQGGRAVPASFDLSRASTPLKSTGRTRSASGSWLIHTRR